MKHLYSLPALLLLVVMLFISGCGKDGEDEGACGSGKTSFSIGASDLCCPSPVFTQYIGGETLDPEKIYYYYYTSGVTQRVVFFFGVTIDQICTEEHLQLKFGYGLELESQDIPMKIYGEAYWSIFQDEVVLTTNDQVPGHGISGVGLEVGLKQAFGDGAATVNVYINVEFDSQGSVTDDTFYISEHIMALSAYAEYSKF